MKLQEIQKIAKAINIQDYRKMKKADLILAIQQTEGNPQCFATDPNNCGQYNCLWRDDCFLAIK